MKKKKAPEKRFKKRIKLIFPILLILPLGITGKLFDIHVMQHQLLTAKSERQYTSTVYSQPRRGIIYDRNGREIAADIEVDSVFANPWEIKNKKEAAKALAEALELPYDQIIKKIKNEKNFVWIKRQVRPEYSAAIRQKDMEGIGFIKEYKRFYPKVEMASRLIGFSGLDNDGLSGVEHSYNDYLRGGGRWLIVERDAKGRQMRSIEKESSKFKQCDIVLTIDEVIQHIAEKELRNKVLETRAKEGIAVVMSPKTGEILAMADYPPFNLNQYRKFGPGLWRNKVVSNAYEPGSTFKVFLAAAGIESGMNPNARFFCENGEYAIGKVTIHEAESKKYGWLSMVDVISKSSNIGAIKIGENLNKKRFHEFITKFGFGFKTGIDLNGEASGLARDLKDWTPLSLCSISIGQEISVTPIQIITALSAIANGGMLLKPHVVKGVYKNGKPSKLFQPEIVHRVISQETSRVMTSILQKVVEEGTGKNAKLEGYSVVGKTGTAQKYDPEINGYSPNKYLASFMGYFPAEDPQLVILVMVDEPKTVYWGGSAATPVLREIAKQAARYLNIPSKLGKVIWVNGDQKGEGEKDPEDYFKEEDEEFYGEGVLAANISEALRKLKDSPRFYNDMQVQRSL